MSYIAKMFETHPVRPSSDHATAIECIAACYACAEACNACADACLGEAPLDHLVACIRLDEDCADICLATARVISRLTATDKNVAGALLRACEAACSICSGECEVHGNQMTHCAVCATACRRCAEACRNLLKEAA